MSATGSFPRLKMLNFRIPIAATCVLRLDEAFLVFHFSWSLIFAG